MTAVAPDHDKLLRLAHLAFIARDNKALWKADTEAACEAHMLACDAMWEEAEQQVRLYLEPSSPATQFPPRGQTTP